LNYTLPEWGGSAEAVRAEFERVKGLGVDAEGLLYLEDQFIARPWKLSTPGAPRAYWEQAIRKHPTQRRLSGLLADFIDLSNWSEALPVADRLIAAYPDDRKAYYQRATVNEHLGRIPEARQDYRMAAAMGHDLALQAVMMAYIRGGLGVDKSFDGALELCRYGATLGSKVGANCLGALYSEGGRGGVNFPNDHAQSLAWHLVGARAGHFNSQYDLGWFLFTGRGAGMDKAEAKTVGTFWLRRAAEQDHQFAGRKLAENKLPLSEEPPPVPLAEGWMGYAKLVYKVLVAMIPGLH
jgi:tetratricopeptide (TPR) repeat protein